MSRKIRREKFRLGVEDVRVGEANGIGHIEDEGENHNGNKSGEEISVLNFSHASLP
jgi:hypothetical protein